jgi:hypothetical protein
MVRSPFQNTANENKFRLKEKVILIGKRRQEQNALASGIPLVYERYR